MLDFERVLAGDYYRLFTAMFLHGSQAHLGVNAISLYVIGTQIEKVLGMGRFLLVYLLGGLTGSLASFALTQGASVGASGAIFALFAAQVVFIYKHRALIQDSQKLLRDLGLILLLNVGAGVAASQVAGGLAIDNWGHVGGFVGGLMLTALCGPSYQVRHSDAGPALADATPFGQRRAFAFAYGAAWLVTFAVLLRVLS
jgi:rhomboid protease GluP